MKRLLLSALLAASLHAAPVPIIFDTDIGNDVDDVMALAMIHSLESRGACKLLAVTITKDDPKAAPFVDAMNTFYGRGEIPIGTVRDGPTKGAGRFLGLIDDAAKYPHDLKSGADCPDALALLRQTLAAQPDGSVSLIQVGFFTNFARLLSTPPDQFSPLNGTELIRQKVKVLSVMAGAFQTINFENYHPEYNVIKDIPSVQKLAKEWPTPIIWSGLEIGLAATYPHESIERDFNYAPHHLVKDAYYLYNPPPHDRPTWDLTSVLAVVFPDRDYFAMSPKGRVEILADGFTRFVTDQKGRDQYLVLDPMKSARLRETLVQLTSQPPSH